MDPNAQGAVNAMLKAAVAVLQNGDRTKAVAFLKHKGYSDERIEEATERARRPLVKNFICNKDGCLLSFCSEVNFRRHLQTHASASSHRKLVSGEQLLLQWTKLNTQDKHSLIKSVESSVEVFFGDKVDNIIGDIAVSPNYYSIPRKLIDMASDVSVIGKGNYFELLKFLESSSEHTSLSSDIAMFQLPPCSLTDDPPNIDTLLAEMFGYYSWFLEKELVNSFVIMENAKGDALIMESEQEKERLEQKLEECSIHDLPPVESHGGTVAGFPEAAATSGAAPGSLEAEATSGVAPGSQEAEATSGAAPGSQEAAGTSGAAAGSSKTDEVAINLPMIFERFLCILKSYRFSRSTSRLNFFEAQLQSLCFAKERHMPIFHHTIKDRVLALAIRDHEERILPTMRSALQNYIDELGYGEMLAADKIDLHFVDFPPAHTTKPFLVYMRHRDIVQIYELFDPETGELLEKVLLLTKFGRKLARFLLRYILKNHGQGKCWNGGFTPDNIEVHRGTEFMIVDMEAEDASEDGINADLVQYFKILKTNFCHPDLPNVAPIFFDEFLEDLMKSPSHNSEEFGYFKTTISVHFAIMPPEVWFVIFMKLDQITASNYDDYKILDQPYQWVPESWKSPFKEVYERHRGVGNRTNYKNSYRHLLRFSRNFPLHVLHVLKMHMQGKDQIADNTLASVLTANHCGRHTIELMNYLTRKVLMDNRGVLHPMFQNAWTSFACSDDHSGDDIDEDSGL